MITQATVPIAYDLLHSRLTAAAARSRKTGSSVLLSQTVAIPTPDDLLTIFSLARAQYEYGAYWEQPASGVTLVGAGAARIIRCDGPGRFQEAAAALRHEMASALVENLSDTSDDLIGPIYLGGFAFDPQRPTAAPWAGVFPDGQLVLPRFLLVVRSKTATLTVNVSVESDTDPQVAASVLVGDLESLLDLELAPPRNEDASVLSVDAVPASEGWKSTVVAAAADIQTGRFDKVVLARELRLWTDRPLEAPDILRRLRVAYPLAYVFAVAVPEGCFLGATPELLVRLSNGEVEVTCLAGSTRRGATPEEDDRFGAELLASAKDRSEHEIVACSIQEALTVVCSEVHRSSPEPELMRLQNIQHLHTGFRARVAGGRRLLNLVEALHPTPAVGGYPREVALAEIREREGIDRGWYAGPVGWVNQAGEGEFAVAIRSALLTGRQASLYAGCGIVADSDPKAEYSETCLKFRPMLAALGVHS